LNVKTFESNILTNYDQDVRRNAVIFAMYDYIIKNYYKDFFKFSYEKTWIIDTFDRNNVNVCKDMNNLSSALSIAIIRKKLGFTYIKDLEVYSLIIPKSTSVAAKSKCKPSGATFGKNAAAAVTSNTTTSAATAAAAVAIRSSPRKRAIIRIQETPDSSDLVAKKSTKTAAVELIGIGGTVAAATVAASTTAATIRSSPRKRAIRMIQETPDNSDLVAKKSKFIPEKEANVLPIITAAAPLAATVSTASAAATTTAAESLLHSRGTAAAAATVAPTTTSKAEAVSVSTTSANEAASAALLIGSGGTAAAAATVAPTTTSKAAAVSVSTTSANEAASAAESIVSRGTAAAATVAPTTTTAEAAAAVTVSSISVAAGELIGNGGKAAAAAVAPTTTSAALAVLAEAVTISTTTAAAATAAVAKSISSRGTAAAATTTTTAAAAAAAAAEAVTVSTTSASEAASGASAASDSREIDIDQKETELTLHWLTLIDHENTILKQHGSYFPTKDMRDYAIALLAFMSECLNLVQDQRIIKVKYSAALVLYTNSLNNETMISFAQYDEIVVSLKDAFSFITHHLFKYSNKETDDWKEALRINKSSTSSDTSYGNTYLYLLLIECYF
jgi:hypothetical protein